MFLQQATSQSIFQVPADTLNTSLVRPLLPRLRKSVDILIFNPPYVPTDLPEALDAQDTADIQGSWAGGQSGMHITNVLLEQVEVSAVSFVLFLCHLRISLSGNPLKPRAFLFSSHQAKRCSWNLQKDARYIWTQCRGNYCPTFKR